MSWGAVLGKIFDWLPGRRENYRNQIENIKRQMDEIKKKPYSASNSWKYDRLADKLRTLEQKAKNG